MESLGHLGRPAALGGGLDQRDAGLGPHPVAVAPRGAAASPDGLGRSPGLCPVALGAALEPDCGQRRPVFGLRGLEPAALLAGLCRWPAALVARLGGPGLGGAHQGACGGGAGWVGAAAVWLAPKGSWGVSPPAQADAGPGDRSGDGDPLVSGRRGGGGGTLCAQFFWLPQPAALHGGGESPPPALVVLWGGAGHRQPARHSPAAAGLGPGGAPVAGTVAGVPLPAALCGLLAGGGVGVFHRSSHQVAQLLDPRHPRGWPVDCLGGPAGQGQRVG